jgi:hypothetical protein
MRKKNLEHPIVFTQHENLYTAPAGVDAGCREAGAHHAASIVTVHAQPTACGARAIVHPYVPVDAFLDARAQPSACAPRGAACANRADARPSLTAGDAERARSDDVSFAPRVAAPSATRRRSQGTGTCRMGVIACTTRRGMPRRVRHADRSSLSHVRLYIRQGGRPLRPCFFPTSSRRSAAVCSEEATPARCDPIDACRRVGSRRCRARDRHCHFPLSGSPDPEPDVELDGIMTRRPSPASGVSPIRVREAPHRAEPGPRRCHPIGQAFLPGEPGWSTFVEYNGRMPASGGRAVRFGPHQRRNALER